MANLYNNSAVDEAWDTLGNWWNDEPCTDPALALPATGDVVYLSAQISSGPSTSVTLNHIYVSGYGFNFTGAIGDATFNGGSYNTGTVTGNATFNDSSYNSGTVSGDATFNDSSYNDYGGIVEGNVTFNDNSLNYYGTTVSGNATFNDSSYNNEGTVSGDATFNGNSYNNQGRVSGNATFNDSSYNTGGEVVGNATFSATSAAIQIGGNYTGSYGSVTIKSATSGKQMIARLLNLPWFINL